ncbi:MAG: hypothetical protein Q9P90_05630 [candidate division KSB1 bacterium]|nr:hypothetical protein [candidate division KSB1 bacterium]
MKRAGITSGWILVGFGLFLFAEAAPAQWNLSLATRQVFSDNPFSYRSTSESWISAYSLGIQRGFARFNVSYYGDFSRFSALPERNYYWHQLALWSESETARWGVYANQQINRETYNFYDYLTLTAYARKHIMTDNSYITANAAISRNHYAQLSDLDNWEMSLSVNVNRRFPSRTTVIGGVRYRFKQYSQSTTVDGDRVMPGNSHGPSFGGPGRMGSPGFSQQVVTAPSISQMSFWLRLAQSLTPTTGLAVQYTRQLNLSGSDRYITGVELLDAQESQLFDDPLGYEGYTLQALLTQLLPANMLLRAGALLKYKPYVTQGIFEDAENFNDAILREDTYRSAWLYVQKSFTLSGSALPKVNAYLQLQWIDNASNSFWYDYRSRAISLGLELDF